MFDRGFGRSQGAHTDTDKVDKDERGFASVGTGRDARMRTPVLKAALREDGVGVAVRNSTRLGEVSGCCFTSFALDDPLSLVQTLALT
jgi:hypothetical protein